MQNKIVVGTEIYKSDRFSDLWLKAACANIPQDISVIVFDNNFYGVSESKVVQGQCNSMVGFEYFRLLPNCHQNHSVEFLRQYALNIGADIYIHLDIDCPPLKGVIEKLLQHIYDGADCVTEKAGAHAFAVKTALTIDMSCQRLPFREGERRTRFSDFTSKPDKYGARHFDHCRWMFHEMELRGHRVDIVDYDFVHATIASVDDKDSQRLIGFESQKNLISHVKHVHECFWDHKEVKELLCLK